MKITLHIIVIGLLAHLMSLLFPIQISWLILVLYGGLWEFKGIWPFMTGFVSLFLVWAIYGFGLDIYNSSILSERIGELLSLPYWMVPLITGLVGGLLGGSSTWLGNNLRRLFTR